MKTDDLTNADAARRQLERRVGRLAPERAAARVLIPDYWLRTLATMTAYTRRQDDTDGERDYTQNVTVTVGPDGDCWLQAGGGKLLRFRTWGGGGMSLRTRQALMVLAEAIRLDNEERPQCDEPPNAELRGRPLADGPA